MEHEMENETKIRIWEKVINVQKHFNEIKSKNQALFISILTVCLAGMGYSLINTNLRNTYFEIFNCHIYARSIPVIGAIIFTICFFILDYSVYHKLLKGSVKCGKEIELSFWGQKLSSHQIESVSSNDHLIKIPIQLIRGASSKHKAFSFIILASLIILFIILNFGTLKS